MVYYCHKCCRNVTVDNNMECTDCHDGFIEEFPGNGNIAEEADNTGLIAGPSQSSIQAKQKPGKIDLSINMQPEFLDLTKCPEVQDINKIIFPETPDQVYDFKSGQYLQDFREMDTLGSGKFTVKSFLFKPSKRKMAIKFIHIPHNRYNTNDDNSRRVIELIREISNFRKLSQAPNIVNCFGVCIYEGQALICMEQMDMSLKEVYLKIHELKKPLTPMENDDSTKTLTQEDVDMETAKDSKVEVEEPETLKAQGNTSPAIIFPEELLAYVAVALLDALVACKKENVIHRDIKPENVLINKNGEIKLCDFGEARILHDSLASTFAGTLCYWPPERFESERSKFDVRADIWSLGITLVEIARGSIPYRDKKGNIPSNIILLQHLILQLDTVDLIGKTFPIKAFSNETREFVRLCLNRIQDRPKYDKLQETSLYQKYGSKENEERNQKVFEWLHFYGLTI